jgi:hypothetical protein
MRIFFYDFSKGMQVTIIACYILHLKFSLKAHVLMTWCPEQHLEGGGTLNR